MKKYYTRQAKYLLLTVLAFSLSVANAQITFVWTGAISTDWFTPGNWNNNSVPGVNNQPIIPITSNIPTLSANVVIGSVLMYTGTILDLNGFSLAISSFPNQPQLNQSTIRNGTLQITSTNSSFLPFFSDTLSNVVFSYVGNNSNSGIAFIGCNLPNTPITINTGNVYFANTTFGSSVTVTKTSTTVNGAGAGNIFNGPVIVNATGPMQLDGTFNSSVNIAMGGSPSTAYSSQGGNIYNGVTNITYNGSGSFLTAITMPDVYYADVTFTNTNAGNMFIDFGSQGNIFGGNVTVNGTVNFARNAGGVIFSGTNSQNIIASVLDIAGSAAFSGSALQTITANNINFNSLVMNKSTNYLQLNGNTILTGNLNLTDGIIKTNNSSFTFNSNATVTGGNNSSFIEGATTKFGNTAFTFPIGAGSNYQPLSISAPANTTDAFTAEYFNAAQTISNNTDSTITNLSFCEFWNLSRTTGTSNVNATFGWNSSSCNVTSNIADMRLSVFDGSNNVWKDLGNNGTTGTSTQGTIVINSLANYGSFALANNNTPVINCSNAIVLPASSTASYSVNGTEMWFSFVAASPFESITVTSQNPAGSPPYVANVSLFQNTCGSLQLVQQEQLPLVNGAKLLSIDASNLAVGSTYYIRVRGVGSNAPFTLTLQPVDVFIAPDVNLEGPSISHAYYQNKGQIIDTQNNPRLDIRSYTKNSNPAVYITDTAISYVFAKLDTIVSTPDTLNRVDMKLVGANTGTRVFKAEQVPGYLNYFLGHIPSGITNVNGYYRNVINNVYPNIDLQYYSNNTGIKYYFIVHPGGDPNNIVMQFNGASSVNVTASDGLDINTTIGTLSFEAGHAYQINSAGHPVPMPWQAKFIQVTTNTVKLDIRKYPKSFPLIIAIDQGHSISQLSIQNLDWSTYYGGNFDDEFTDVVTDVLGNIYVTGSAVSANFPVTAGVIQPTHSVSYDAVVCKFDIAGVPQFATFYGGSLNDLAYSIGVDNASPPNIYFTGHTNSQNFITYNSGVSYIQTLINGTGSNSFKDAFIVKLNSTGTVRLWATYYGGDNADEEGHDLVLDGLNNLYVVGGPGTYLTAPTIPTKILTGAYNSAVGTGFILKFTTAGALSWATRIGGNNGSNPSASGLNSCDVDGSNNFYVAGMAMESGYPILNAGGNASHGFDFDGVATKFNVNGAIIWSTYFGGGGEDEVYSIVTVGSSPIGGNAYITGYTTSKTANPIPLQNPGGTAYYHPTFDPIGSGGQTAFLAEFDPAGSLLWGTYFGLAGTSNFGVVTGINMAFDNNQDLFVTGFTKNNALPLPVSNPANVYSKTTPIGGRDAFIASFNNYVYKWGTYFGGSNDDHSHGSKSGVATFQNSKLYFVGGTTSFDFPTVNPGGVTFYQPNNAGGNQDAFISRFDITPVITGINNSSKLDDGIIVYPNPASQNITLKMELTQKQNVEIVLYNLIGENIYSVIFKNQFGTEEEQINLSMLPSGTYIIKIIMENNIISKKIIKRY